MKAQGSSWQWKRFSISNDFKPRSCSLKTKDYHNLITASLNNHWQFQNSRISSWQRKRLKGTKLLMISASTSITFLWSPAGVISPPWTPRPAKVWSLHDFKRESSKTLRKKKWKMKLKLEHLRHPQCASSKLLDLYKLRRHKVSKHHAPWPTKNTGRRCQGFSIFQILLREVWI